MISMYNGIIFSHKKEEILSFEHKYLEHLESIVLSEVRLQRKIDTELSLYMWNLKQKQTISEKKSRLVVARGRVCREKGIGQMWT